MCVVPLIRGQVVRCGRRGANGTLSADGTWGHKSAICATTANRAMAADGAQRRKSADETGGEKVTATYKQMFRVGLLLVSFMLFFFPYEYAVGRTVYLLWKGLLCLASLGYTVAVLASPRHISPCWVLFLLFYVDYYLISGLISQTGKLPGINISDRQIQIPAIPAIMISPSAFCDIYHNFLLIICCITCIVISIKRVNNG